MFKKLFSLKTITGGILVLGGAALSAVPIVNAASPYIMKGGMVWLTAGALDKGRKVLQKKDAFDKEKKLIKKVRRTKDEN